MSNSELINTKKINDEGGGINLEINLDKILNDYLEKLRNNTPDLDDELATKSFLHAAEIAARACISVLREYETLEF